MDPEALDPLDAKGRDQACQRPFYLRPRAFWVDLAIRFGFHILQEKIEGDSRPGRTWLSLTLQKNASDRPGALDVFASVLGRDAKTTSYKFALIRALADLAVSP